MKVLVATSDVPFVEGGHRVIARALVKALQESGHEAELLTTPTNRFGRQFSAYLATRFTDVECTGGGEPVDQLISLRFPSYALKHPNHVCWLNHRMREYYDLWPGWSGALGWKGKIKETIRKKCIHAADRHFLKSNVKKVFAQSKNVQRQLLHWGNIPSEVLYPPPPSNGYYTEKYGDYIFSPARLTPLKRIPLLLESLKYADRGKVILAGEGSDKDQVLDWIKKNSMENRVQWLGHVPTDRLLQLYAGCRAVYYSPVNEDYGLVTMEAFRSRKPVITTTDSGGPAELVRDGVSGFVCEPRPEEIGRRITNLFEAEGSAEKLGTTGYEVWKHITWQETVARLIHRGS
ncbi:glycosyltransferase family 4 protein [bacterium]|nr:glycosyltransferase family 4 protein [bacterium]